ncbi:HAMP domain-containing protein [Aquimarina brevivitae]|uniref:histidine kinase n=1 Tax=Aquimarina brevivitae TaxID=323412 RepID=A0A4Q7PI25_9FLAO|nr:HAMP domain-containing protein [Aquimarina brevivitae]RZT00252.1 HAMP domain-containing protein [Aquimarina brevivitae]
MQLSIKQKVLLILFVVSVVPIIGIIIWQYNYAIDSLTNRSFEQLNTIKQIKKKELEWYFSKIRTETGLFAQSKFAVNAMYDFKQAFSELKDVELIEARSGALEKYYTDHLQGIPFEQDMETVLREVLPQNNRTIYLQSQYLKKSRLPREAFNYEKIHERFHKTFSDFVARYDMYDLFLIEDKTGNIVYSVKKEIDFATNLLDGPYANSKIGLLYRDIRDTGLKTTTLMCDFDRYLPSKMAPAAFLAAPIFDERVKIGTMIVQIPLKKINQITTGTQTWQEEGLGDTGETYIVGNDYKMRTDSRFILEEPDDFLETVAKANTASKDQLQLMDHYNTTVLFQPVETTATQKALKGMSGTVITENYRGIEVLSSFIKLDIDDISWVLLAEIDSDEIFYAVKTEARKSLWILILVFLITLLVASFLGKMIYKPIRTLTQSAAALGKGNFDVKVKVNHKGELANLAHSFNEMVVKLKKGREEIIAKNELLSEQRDELQKQSEALKKMNEEILSFNEKLEDLVRQRTAKLKSKNKILLDYAFFNSHKLRAPISNILGLIHLLSVNHSEHDRAQTLSYLQKSAKDLDDMVREAQELLNQKDL